MRVCPVAARAALLSLVFALTLEGQPYTFRYYVATQGGPGRSDGPGASARFWSPEAVAVDASGNVFVADTENKVIRMIAVGGEVRTLAGMEGVSGTADGFGATARFDRPVGIAVDPAGSIYVSDTTQHTIRKITPAGLVTTFAGKAGFSGSANGTGSAARFFIPAGIACDNDGNVYVADYGTHTIRKITPGAVVSTIAGLADTSGSDDGTGSAARFNRPLGVATDASDNVYVADWLNNTIRRITPAGVVITIAGAAGVGCGYVDGTGTSARFCSPRKLAVGLSNALYVADAGNNRVRKIDLGSGSVTTYAGSGQSQSVDGTGTDASFAGVQAVATDVSDNVFVAELHGHAIRRILPGAVVTTYAGMAAASGDDTGSGIAARFKYPEDVAVDASGNIFVASGDTIRKIPWGTLQPIVFAGSPGFSGGDDGVGTDARFRQASGLATDAAGNLYVADRNAHTIRKITPAADVSTLAGGYVQIGSDDGDGTAARFNTPTDLVVDGAGNVYVADRYNHTIRKITPAGTVTTLAGMAGFTGTTDATGSAARFNEPMSITLASDGNLYVLDRANFLVRRVTMAGVVTTIAGLAGTAGSEDGSGTAARFWYPERIAADANGNLFVADGANTVRRITLAGAVTTLGGIFQRKGSEDGTGSVSRFSELKGIASTPDGVLYLIDAFTLRRGAPALNAVAAIDQASGPVGVPRQLQTTGAASVWDWKVVRRPAGSTATLSSSGNPSPTFTPDVPDLFVFRLSAGAGTSSSVTEVTLSGTVSPTLALGPSSLPYAVIPIVYSATLTASGGTAPYVFTRIAGSLPTGMSLDSAGVISGAASSAGTFNFDVRATDSVGATGTRSYSITVSPSAFAVTANATSTTTVSLTWPAVTGAASYRVYRSDFLSNFSPIATPATNSFTDTTALAGKSYLYRVTARNQSNQESQPGAADLATTVMFTDPTLTAGVTPIRAVHVSQLRTAVNAVRALAGFANAAFTDPSLSAGAAIKAAHLTELRSALTEARESLVLPLAPPFVDETITPGVTPAKAIHIEQLRSSVR